MLESGEPYRRTPDDARARSLMHLIGLLEWCYQTPSATESQRVRWRADGKRAGKALEAIFASGLSREFLGGEIETHRRAGGASAKALTTANAKATAAAPRRKRSTNAAASDR